MPLLILLELPEEFVPDQPLLASDTLQHRLNACKENSGSLGKENLLIAQSRDNPEEMPVIRSSLLKAPYMKHYQGCGVKVHWIPVLIISTWNVTRHHSLEPAEVDVLRENTLKSAQLRSNFASCFDVIRTSMKMPIERVYRLCTFRHKLQETVKSQLWDSQLHCPANRRPHQSTPLPTSLVASLWWYENHIQRLFNQQSCFIQRSFI